MKFVNKSLFHRTRQKRYMGSVVKTLIKIHLGTFRQFVSNHFKVTSVLSHNYHIYYTLKRKATYNALKVLSLHYCVACAFRIRYSTSANEY